MGAAEAGWPDRRVNPAKRSGPCARITAGAKRPMPKRTHALRAVRRRFIDLLLTGAALALSFTPSGPIIAIRGIRSGKAEEACLTNKRDSPLRGQSRTSP